MFGTEQLIAQYLGDSPAATVAAGLSILILINLVVTIILATRSKDDAINFNLLPDFIKPILLYTAFIAMMEAMMVIAGGIPILRTSFFGIEVIGVAAVALKYAKQIYEKLKALGMSVDEKLDAVIQQKLDTVIDNIDYKKTEEKATSTVDLNEWYPEGRDDESER